MDLLDAEAYFKEIRYPTDEPDTRLSACADRTEEMKSKDQAEKARANAKAMSEVITITLVLFCYPLRLSAGSSPNPVNSSRFISITSSMRSMSLGFGNQAGLINGHDSS